MIDYASTNVKDIGAQGNGVADDSAAFTAAIALGGKIVVPEGTYRISSVELKSNITLEFEPNTTIIPTGNDVVLFTTPADSFTDPSVVTSNCKVKNCNFDFTGFTGCQGFKIANLRHTSGIYNANGEGDTPASNNIGINLKRLNWNTDVAECYMKNMYRSYIVEDGSNAVNLLNCRGNVADIHVYVENGEYATESVSITGGFYQGGQINIYDKGWHTTLANVYSEVAEISDVYYDTAKFPVINSLHLTAPSASPTSAGITAFNTVGADLNNIVNIRGDGFGTFKFDNSNEYCYASYQHSETISNELGLTTGIQLKNNWVETAKDIGDIGVLDGYLVGTVGIAGDPNFQKRTVRLSNSFHKTTTPAGTSFGVDGEFTLFRKNVSGDTAFTISGTPLPSQEIKAVLYTSVDLTANTITIAGQDIDTSTATGGDRVAIITLIYIDDLSRWTVAPVKWEPSV